MSFIGICRTCGYQVPEHASWCPMKSHDLNNAPPPAPPPAPTTEPDTLRALWAIYRAAAAFLVTGDAGGLSVAVRDLEQNSAEAPKQRRREELPWAGDRTDWSPGRKGAPRVETPCPALTWSDYPDRESFIATTNDLRFVVYPDDDGFNIDIWKSEKLTRYAWAPTVEGAKERAAEFAFRHQGAPL